MGAAWEIPDELLSRATPEELEAYIADLQVLAKDWRSQARPEQLPPDGDWRVWYLQGGRGSGKTRAAAETFAEWILATPDSEWGVVAPTFGAARDVCIEGVSGLIKALGGMTKHGGHVVTWNRSLGELRVDNGAVVFIDGAKDGAPGMQGHNLNGSWCDEPGKWAPSRIKDAWDEGVQFATRVGIARIIVSGTPKQGHPLVKELVGDPEIPKTRLKTLDNIRNLAKAAVDRLVKKYGHTRLGRQELEGDYLDDVEGAQWSSAQLEACRIARSKVPGLARVVVAVDPSGGDEEGNDEQGIVVAGRGVDAHGYVLADRSCKLSPDGWARRAIAAYHEFKADCIVVERNFGGDMVRHTIHTIDRNIPVRDVVASRGKQQRTEPVAAMYGDPTRPDSWAEMRVHHVYDEPDSAAGEEYHAVETDLAELESQMTKWVQGSGWSPDRMDALVWGLTQLFPSEGSSFEFLGTM